MKRNVARKHARPFARRLSSFAGDLRGARMVVLDANMSGGVLAHAASIAKDGPSPSLLWFEPVSVAKCRRFRDVVSVQGVRVDFASPNVAELVSMSLAVRDQGHDPSAETAIETPDVGGSAEDILRSVSTHAATVIAAGVECIILTMGAHGAAAIVRSGAHSLEATLVPAVPVRTIANVHGAGDALAGGCISGIAQHGADSISTALALGVAAAAAALASDSSRIAPGALASTGDGSLLSKSAEATALSYTIQLQIGEPSQVD